MKELKVIQLNITYLNDTVVRWIVSKMEHEHVHVFLLQEHRLHKQQYHETCKHLRRYFHVIMRPANIKNEAPSGGATILIRKDLQVVPGYCPRVKQDITSNGMMVCLRIKGCSLILVSAYLNPSNPNIRYQTMQSISSWIGIVGCPWIVAGDFNTPPEELTHDEWDIVGKGVVHTPDLEKTTTLTNGRIVDYAIMDPRAHTLIKDTQPVYDAPCRPHIGIMYTIDAKPRDVRVPKFLRPKKIDASGEKRDPLDFNICLEKNEFYIFVRTYVVRD